jgi:hypothetical protein
MAGVARLSDEYPPAGCDVTADQVGTVPARAVLLVWLDRKCDNTRAEQKWKHGRGYAADLYSCPTIHEQFHQGPHLAIDVDNGPQHRQEAGHTEDEGVWPEKPRGAYLIGLIVPGQLEASGGKRGTQPYDANVLQVLCLPIPFHNSPLSRRS